MSQFWSALKPEDRKNMRAEMMRMVIAGMTESNPTATKGAIRVKAAKFVDAAIEKEMRADALHPPQVC